MTSPNEQTPQMRPIDPVLQEQFEIQMRSQYKWQANNTWLYWPFMGIAACSLAFGIYGLIVSITGEFDVFAIIFTSGFGILGGVLLVSLWSGYKTARLMAEKLKQAEAEGR